MKFGKEFRVQMVQEWQEAYMDYNSLKTILKEVLRFKTKGTNSPTKLAASNSQGPLKRRASLYRAFSGLTSRYRGSTKKNEDEVILVSGVEDGEEGHYQTTFLNVYEQGGEYELVFFRRLDDEFNKVVDFYRKKVGEVLEEAESLSRQMDALIALRIKVEKPRVGGNNPVVAEASTSAFSAKMDVIQEVEMASPEANTDDVRRRGVTTTSAFSAKMDVIQEVEMASPEANTDDVRRRGVATTSAFSAKMVVIQEVEMASPEANTDDVRRRGVATTSAFSAKMDVIQEVEMASPEANTDDVRRRGFATTSAFSAKMDVIQEVEMASPEANTDDVRRRGVAPLEVLDRVKINIEPETPVSTMKNIISGSISDLLYSKGELRDAEGLMTCALVKFHQKLLLLKSYCFLNQLAFSKILKKYDKITSRKVSKAYLNMVDNSYLGTSEEVIKLLERVEITFIKHFTNGNRSKGMQTLRPKAKRERHRVTFFLGLFSGCSIALVVAMAVLIHARNILDSPGGPVYMENMFPLYSLFGFIVLHLLMYAADIYFWKRYRVNYVFIFGFKQGTELGYKEVLLLGSGLAVLALGGVLSNLDMEMDPRTESFEAITELVPLGLLLLVLLIIFCPFNIIYRSSRYFLIGCALHCLLAPLYKVTLPDFFLADQLTSQVQALRNLEFYVCYYGWGDFKKRSNTCQSSEVFDIFYLVLAIIPYWIRFLQCIRRLFEEKSSMQGYNALKYMSTIVAVAMRTSFDLETGKTWRILAAASSGFATVINTYWDIVIDWGLLRQNSVNPWLRDKLVIPNKSVYFIAMGSNVVLRLAWMQTVLNFRDTPFLHRSALTAIFASLEIVRRGIWNFFRLENEHLNNVGQYRAFKSVPLPFHYDDEEEEKRV